MDTCLSSIDECVRAVVAWHKPPRTREGVSGSLANTTLDKQAIMLFWVYDIATSSVCDCVHFIVGLLSFAHDEVFVLVQLQCDGLELFHFRLEASLLHHKCQVASIFSFVCLLSRMCLPRKTAYGPLTNEVGRLALKKARSQIVEHLTHLTMAEALRSVCVLTHFIHTTTSHPGHAINSV
mmetsp:Transcript_9181/g.16926  ORF Transcript_9181/g.16926 Transcript_9181/m.16926 type:complete len:180 (+) Transcript_9181:1372-1911(+)